MFRSILHNFTRLAVFSGREGRPQFWSYVVIVLTLYLAVGMAIMIPETLGSMQRMQEFAVAHPEQSKVVVGPGRYSVQIQGRHPELMPDVAAIMTTSVAALAGLVVLLAAAVVRRLHDCGRSALWSVLPLPFVAISAGLFPRLLDGWMGPNPDVGLFFLLFASNVLYLGALGLLAVLLAGRPTPGPNRFGPPA